MMVGVGSVFFLEEGRVYVIGVQQKKENKRVRKKPAQKNKKEDLKKNQKTCC